jgi:hypothetical protein
MMSAVGNPVKEANGRARILGWQTAGAVFIIGLGSTLHFLFAWSGGWRPVALIAAVNESVWEHLKLVYWPGLIFLLLSFPFLKKKTRNFWAAGTAGLLTMPLTIVVLFYGHKIIFRTHHLVYDIAIFVLAAIVGQWIGYRLMLRRPFSRTPRRIAAALLLAATLAFSLFSFYPPQHPLFQDSRTGEYGIPGAGLRR